jgi:hypothetical protein
MGVLRSSRLIQMKRTATIVVVGGAFLAWLAGAATSNRALAPQPIAQRTAIEVRGDELAVEVARLHERLRPTATPRRPGRNLFSFQAAAARAVPVAPLVVTPAPALVEAPAAPAAQIPLKLAGIAEDAGPEGPVRTAIISAPGQLFLVKEGETVMMRYRITRISADVVELVDLGDNSVRRLALR